jgi:hypothetical protein
MSDEDDGEEEDDPFERLGASVGDREGDPFEAFEDVDTDDERDGWDAHIDTDDESDDNGDEPTDPLADSEETPSEHGYDGHDITPAAHTDELPDEEEDEGTDAEGVVEVEEPEIDTGSDDSVGGVGEHAGDPFDEGIFEEMEVGELDPDDVWESISDAERRGSVSQQAERIYADVSKHRYCEQCEFFSDPPDISCSHEGTEILEFLDQETVRVVDCPVVAERKELKKHE